MLILVVLMVPLWPVRPSRHRASLNMRSRTFKEDYRQLLALTDSVPVVVWSVVLVAVLALAPLLIGKYFTTLVLLMMITAVGVLGLNLLTGNAGLISLGHSGFLAVGAYAAGIVAGKLGWPMPLALLAGGVTAALAGLVVGIPSLRLKGLYLAITTMAFAVIINHLILNGGKLTGGSEGLSVPQPALFGMPLATEGGFYYVVLAVLVLAVFVTLNLLRSRVAARSWRSASTTSPHAPWAWTWCAGSCSPSWSAPSTPASPVGCWPTTRATSTSTASAC